MTFLKKMALGYVILILMASPVLAARIFIGLGEGYAYNSSDFKNSLVTTAKASLMSDWGLSLDGRAGFTSIKNTNDDDHVSVTSLIGGPTFHFQKNPRGNPYIGLLGGLTSTESRFQSPKTAYGLKLGVNYKLYTDLLWFFEYENLTMKESEANTKVNSQTISTGFLIKLSGQEPLLRNSDISAEQRLREYRKNAQQSD